MLFHTSQNVKKKFSFLTFSAWSNLAVFNSDKTPAEFNCRFAKIMNAGSLQGISSSQRSTWNKWVKVVSFSKNCIHQLWWPAAAWEWTAFQTQTWWNRQSYPNGLLGWCMSSASAQHCCKCAVRYFHINAIGAGLTQAVASAQQQHWVSQSSASWVRHALGHFWEGGRWEGEWSKGIPRGGTASERGGARIRSYTRPKP